VPWAILKHHQNDSAVLPCPKERLGEETPFDKLKRSVLQLHSDLGTTCSLEEATEEGPFLISSLVEFVLKSSLLAWVAIIMIIDKWHIESHCAQPLTPVQLLPIGVTVRDTCGRCQGHTDREESHT